MKALACLAIVAIAGCGDASKGAAAAKGDTPVKYVICNQSQDFCFVSARFQDIDGCNRYRERDALACKKMEPGHIACSPPGVPPIAEGHCVL